MTYSRDSFSSVPINAFLGFILDSHDATTASVSFRPQPEHTQEYGIVHGGIISALADNAAVYTVYPSLPETQWMTSIEFKVNFLAPARPDQGEVIAQAHLVRRGRSIAVVHVEVHQREAHVATGLFTYLIANRT